LIPRFLPRLTLILKQYADDPTAIVNLTIKLLGPVPFEDVFSLAQADELIVALDSPAPAANLLGMAILHKATAAPRFISFFCTHPDLVAAFIRRWLVAPQVEVGQKGSKVLGDLLDIDSAQPPPPPPTRPADASHTDLSIRRAPGDGKLWDLLFRNHQMYTLFLDLVSGHHPDMLANRRQVSLAQGRVLRLLPRLAAIDFRAVSQSDFLAPTPAYLLNGHANDAMDVDGDGNGEGEGETRRAPPPRPPRPGEGLLQYAALRLVQRTDLLMHLSLVDFFEALLALMRVTEPSDLKLQTLRAVVGEAVAEDEVLREALLTLPDRTVEEEAEDLTRWLREVMPGEEVRMAVR
jgi:hypothetical protein